MNKKSLIFNIILAVLSLAFIILAVIPLVGGYEYSLLHYSISYIERGGIGLIYGIPMIAAFIGNIIGLIFTVLSILTACNIIKGMGLAKLFRTIRLKLLRVTAYLAIISSAAFSMAGRYYTTITFAIITLIMAVVATMDRRYIKKLAKAEK